MDVCGQSFNEPLLNRLRETIRQERRLSRRAPPLRLCVWLDWKSPLKAAVSIRPRHQTAAPASTGGPFNLSQQSKMPIVNLTALSP
jgi:hypothetical protein